MPEAAIPSPTPVKMIPPANPRRAAGTTGSKVGAASTINMPPARPAAKRQTKNQRNESGRAQAKKAVVASAIIMRSRRAAGIRATSGRASSAPAR